MRVIQVLRLALLSTLLTGCGILTTGEDTTDAEAQRQMELAQQLEISGAVREAAHEYALTAESYPRSTVHAAAVRKAALLYASSENPARNDSTAEYWLNTYLALDLPREERELATRFLDLLVQTRNLKTELERQAELKDSLTGVVKTQSATMARQAQTIEELERQLAVTAEELKKLKEIDVRTARPRRAP